MSACLDKDKLLEIIKICLSNAIHENDNDAIYILTQCMVRYDEVYSELVKGLN